MTPPPGERTEPRSRLASQLLGWGPAVWFELIKELQLNFDISSLQWRRCLLLNTRLSFLSMEATENNVLHALRFDNLKADARQFPTSQNDFNTRLTTDETRPHPTFQRRRGHTEPKLDCASLGYHRSSSQTQAGLRLPRISPSWTVPPSDITGVEPGVLAAFLQSRDRN